MIPIERLRQMVDGLIDDVAKSVYVETLLAKRELEEKALREKAAMFECYCLMSSQAITSMIKSKLPGIHTAAAKEALLVVKEEEKKAAGAGAADAAVPSDTLEPTGGGDDPLAHIRALKHDAARRAEEKARRLDAIRTEISMWDYGTLEAAVSQVDDPDERLVFNTMMERKKPLPGSSCVPPPPPPPPPYEQSQYYYTTSQGPY
jgi:hypothetical protein